MPSPTTHREEGLRPIEGTPPDLFAPPVGCSYYGRCPYAMRICKDNHPPAFGVHSEHYALCWLQHEDAPHRAPALQGERS